MAKHEFNTEHCIELAKKNHLDGTARVLTTGTRRELFWTPSIDRSGEHIVCHVYETHGLYCDCQAAQTGTPNCGHIGAAILYIDQRSECLTGHAA